MSKISRFPGRTRVAPDTSQDAQMIAEAIIALVRRLSASEQEKVVREITDALRPIDTPRAGELLGTIVRLLPNRPEWSVRDIEQQVAEQGVDANKKEIYNALGYLNRKGHVRRIGYGRYLVGGGLLVTADDLGGEPVTNEDD